VVGTVFGATEQKVRIEMKTIAVLLVLMVVSNAYAQDWRDTLELARSAYKSNDFDKALGYYEKAQRSAPNGVDFSDEMGQSAYKAEKYDVAEKIYQQNQTNKSSSKSQADNFHNLGNSRMRNKDFKGAADAYKDALRRNPNDKKTRYNLSEAIRQINKEERKQQQQQKQQQQSQGNKQQQQQQQQQQGNGSPQQSQNGKQQSQNGSQPKQQGGQGQQQSQQQKGNGSPSKSQGKQGGKGQLSNKTAERMLDDLMKREAETQRRMAGSGSGSGSSKSGKDW
jgi:Ca-activated chloride channel family protein